MTPRPEVLTVGETMVLVTPAVAEPLETATAFHLDPGGAESNVACHLAALGTSTAWASAVGDDALGRRLVHQIGEHGVDTAWVRRDASAPTGLYVKDPGNGVRYYRAGSAASRLEPSFADGLPIDAVRLVHVSGITPALSPSCDALIDAIFDRAAAAGVPVSFDVNLRASLWPSTDAAARRLLDLAARADLVFVGLDEAQVLWGAQAPDDVRRLLPDVRELVVKDGAVGATSYERDLDGVHVPAFVVDVVEVVGAGDAFAAGYLHAMLHGAAPDERLLDGHERAVLTIADTADVPRGTR
ncbi:sugar kinase [Agromyces aureus]|uniref:Carbohydrate kinase n=1 Tax=Agromyces aureus TaxID=453304 RepID=A0A191WDB1_9MICO|nr:sugar kinase [Agromyces aureus]ANJ26255.1 carbohydrate kinase [Agromyces aureus]